MSGDDPQAHARCVREAARYVRMTDGESPLFDQDLDAAADALVAQDARIKELEAERNSHACSQSMWGSWARDRIAELEADIERLKADARRLYLEQLEMTAARRPDDVVVDKNGKWLRIEQDPSARTRHDRVTASYTVDGVTYDDRDRPMDRTPLYRLVPVEEPDE